MRAIGAVDPKEIIWTSGATESNNIAILGAAEMHKEKGNHIIVSGIEHKAILDACKKLEKEGFEITYLEVDKNGLVSLSQLNSSIKRNTILVSIMYANNEIGTIQPIKEIAKEIRHFNKLNNTKVLLHTDATQAINYLEINVEKLGIDIMSFNAGKIYGPKGIGALYVRRRTPVRKIIFGGDQEYGMRAGTENLASVVGFAKALEITEKIKIKENKRLKKLQDYFIKKLQNLEKGIVLNGDLENRLPNNINITIPKIPSDLLVIELSARGIMVSAKSACKSGEEGESYVIKAIKPEADQENGSIRFSLGRSTTKEDLDFTLKSLKEILTKLKKWYN
jgi:cysteine desulfurase